MPRSRRLGATRLSRTVTALLEHRSGATAAEFALLLPLMCTMLIGTLQAGLMMYAYNDMTSVARDVVRQMAVCTLTDPVAATNQARGKLMYETPWVPADGANGWQISTSTIGQDVQMTIQVTPAAAGIIAYLPFNVGLLTTRIEMAQEPLAYGAGSC